MPTLLHQDGRKRDSHVTLDERQIVEFALAVGSPNASPEYLGRLAKSEFVDLKIPKSIRDRTEIELQWVTGKVENKGAIRRKILERERVIQRIQDEKRLLGLTASGITVFDRNGLMFDWQPNIKGWPTLLDFGLALLLDPKRPYSNFLYRCQWRECQRFFLTLPAKEQGSFRTRYCCEEHYKDADKDKVAERVRRHRAKQARLKK